MTKLEKIMAESEKMGEHNDCAVRAVTALTNLPYAYVHKVFENVGRKRRGKTPQWITYEVLKRLQMDVYPCYKLQHAAKTVKSLKSKLPRKGRFMVHTRGHVLAAVNGEIIDWTDGRRHRIKEVVRITF